MAQFNRDCRQLDDSTQEAACDAISSLEPDDPKCNSTMKRASGNDCGILGYAHSEYSLASPSTREIISQQRLPLFDDNDDTDEGDISDEEVELCSVVLSIGSLPRRATCHSMSLLPSDSDLHYSRLALEQSSTTPSDNMGQRLYLDVQQYEIGPRPVAMRGGAEVPLPGSDQIERSNAGQDELAVSAPPFSSESTPELRYERLLLSTAELERHQRVQHRAFSCPISGCQMALNAATLLSHCLLVHQEVMAREMNAGESIQLRLDPEQLLQSQNSCLAVLLYRSNQQLVVNVDLPPSYHYWQGHTAIVLMLCKTSWDTLGHRCEQLGSIQPASKDAADVANLYIFWLLCPQAMRPFVLQLGVFDAEGGLLKRAQVQTCSTMQLMEINDVLGTGPHFMRMTHNDLKQLTKNFSQAMQLEVALVEQRETRPVKHDDNQM
ncbi:uncharacterized protein LOC115627597 [Scaptodrosophila lebanonensis]|uniref:Uncharacterized protein LOC115627597 n=1 Tax=Drosophila lebanonensis TaxID=7225 RepID=A0A6J2TR96_DROLE|nr:uncharacterized protein LOC115627597 [Scaptodrosophila lebanonensis]